jgi:hypothetical protein
MWRFIRAKYVISQLHLNVLIRVISACTLQQRRKPEGRTNLIQYTDGVVPGSSKSMSHAFHDLKSQNEVMR